MCMHVCAGVWFCVYGWFAECSQHKLKCCPILGEQDSLRREERDWLGESSSEKDRLEMHTINSLKKKKKERERQPKERVPSRL